MLSRFLLRSSLVLAVALAAGAATAQDFKIGFVNSDKIFREANIAKASQAKLELEFGKREKEIIDLGNTLKAGSDKLEREAATLSESQRTTRQRALVESDREFQRKRREFQEDLNTRKNEELQVVVERANRMVRQIAETDKFDLVMQEAVYINPKHDITDRVIAALNAAK